MESNSHPKKLEGTIILFFKMEKKTSYLRDNEIQLPMSHMDIQFRPLWVEVSASGTAKEIPQSSVANVMTFRV